MTSFECGLKKLTNLALASPSVPCPHRGRHFPSQPWRTLHPPQRASVLTAAYSMPGGIFFNSFVKSYFPLRSVSTCRSPSSLSFHPSFPFPPRVIAYGALSLLGLTLRVVTSFLLRSCFRLCISSCTCIPFTSCIQVQLRSKMVCSEIIYIMYYIYSFSKHTHTYTYVHTHSDVSYNFATLKNS